MEILFEVREKLKDFFPESLGKSEACIGPTEWPIKELFIWAFVKLISMKRYGFIQFTTCSLIFVIVMSVFPSVCPL